MCAVDVMPTESKGERNRAVTFVMMSTHPSVKHFHLSSRNTTMWQHNIFILYFLNLKFTADVHTSSVQSNSFVSFSVSSCHTVKGRIISVSGCDLRVCHLCDYRKYMKKRISL